MAELSYLLTPVCRPCRGSDGHDCVCGKWRPIRDRLFLHSQRAEPCRLEPEVQQQSTLNDAWDGPKAEAIDCLIPEWYLCGGKGEINALRGRI